MTDFALPVEIEQLRAEAERFASLELVPHARAHEKSLCWSAAVLDVLAKLGLREVDLPGDWGGADAGVLAKVVLLETLASGDAGGLPAADQPGLATGALAACPDAGLARRIAAECLAGRASLALVCADPEAPELTPAIHWAPSWPQLRWAFVSRGDALALFELTRALEPARALAFGASGGVGGALAGASKLGEWTLARHQGVTLRGRARLWCGAVALGVAQSAFDATVRYTTERVVFGKPVAHHQGNAFELAVAATSLHGARLLVRAAAAALDRAAADAGFWATEAWIAAVEAAVAVSDLGVQLLGGHGFLVDHLAEKRFREARMLALLAGGRDLAEADLAELVLEVPDSLTQGGPP